MTVSFYDLLSILICSCYFFLCSWFSFTLSLIAFLSSYCLLQCFSVSFALLFLNVAHLLFQMILFIFNLLIFFFLSWLLWNCKITKSKRRQKNKAYVKKIGGRPSNNRHVTEYKSNFSSKCGCKIGFLIFITFWPYRVEDKVFLKTFDDTKSKCIMNIYTNFAKLFLWYKSSHPTRQLRSQKSYHPTVLLRNW